MAREDLGLDRVLFIPTGQPWRKAGREIASASDRIAMLRLATAGNPAFDISTLEVDRDGPSYTEVTLEALLKEKGKETELFLVLGRDSLADLPHWHDPQRIAELATLVVADRDGAGVASESEPGLPGIVARLCWLRMPRIDINSTDIRNRVRDGRSIRYRVPEGVASYIEERGLYRKGTGNYSA
ncbi:MAG: nicotinate-nucleotide adenylyltransferase [Actinomycetota bacterium]|nr:nicotinate-nucleotide adenylyltransferase [Actinomycetota bacterium]